MFKASNTQHFRFFAPLGAGALGILSLYSIGGESSRALPSLISMYVFPPLGKESIIPLGISLNIDIFTLVSTIIIIDLIAALFVYWNYDLIKRIQYLRRILDKMENRAQSVVKKKWIGKVWWIGLTLFMILPFQGSGSIMTTVLGRIIGVRWKVLVVVFVGSTISSLSIAFASETIFTYLFQ